jgi:hypothetical protein
MAHHHQQPVGRPGHPGPAGAAIIVAAPETVEMEPVEIPRAVHAWAVLTAACWHHAGDGSPLAVNDIGRRLSTDAAKSLDNTGGGESP